MFAPLVSTVLIFAILAGMLMYAIPDSVVLGCVGGVIFAGCSITAFRYNRWWFSPAVTSLGFFWLLYARLAIKC
jgi:hypothetical protein